MFTGIIEEIGTLHHIRHKGQTLGIDIRAKLVLEGIKVGDSIAVNGTCLTVTTFNSASFTADVMPVTYKATNLSNLKNGDQLNLERALTPNSRMGGHIVSGHIDGIATIIEVFHTQNSIMYKLQLNQDLIKYCIPKGSIALDGTSLTIVESGDNWVSVSLIPHTQKVSALSTRKIGALVNVECDIMAKQLAKLTNCQNSGSKITEGFLQEHGYL